MKPSEVIEKYGWVQGQAGNVTDGFCLTGAISQAFPGFSHRQISRRLKKIAAVQAAMLPLNVSLIDWNDAPRRTKRQVLAVLRKAGL